MTKSIKNLDRADITVVICCYNSATRIKPTLEHISKQILASLEAELIIVDNNCTDNTVDVAQQHWKTCGNPFSLRVVKERQPGLSFARKAGALAASGDFIVFCDDDNWLREDYLTAAYYTMSNNHEIGVLSGRSEAVSDVELPFWFSTYQRSFAVGVQGLESGVVEDRTSLWGAGMVVRKELLHLFYNSGLNHLLSDRTEGKLISGGDDEICIWFLLINKKLYYSDRLALKHYMSKERLSIEYLKKLKAGFRESSRTIQLYNLIINHLKHGSFFSFKNTLKSLMKLNFIEALRHLSLWAPFGILFTGDEEFRYVLSVYRKLTSITANK